MVDFGRQRSMSSLRHREGNVMALVHPDKAAPVQHSGKIHPLVCFLAGFALIVIAAAVVHTVFGIIL